MQEINFRNNILPLKDKLFRLALRITLNREEAEDIVQDTLLKIWDKRNELHKVDNIEAFAMTICRNLSLDHTEKKERLNFSLDETEHDRQDTLSVSPDQQVIMFENIQMVRNIIDQLPEKQRTIVQLRDIEEKTYKDIAQIMQITESDVKVNLFRARKTIKETFEKINKNGL